MKNILASITALSLAVICQPATAATYVFDFTGKYDAEFSLQSSQLMPPASYGSNSFQVSDVSGTFAGNKGSATVTFANIGALDQIKVVSTYPGSFFSDTENFIGIGSIFSGSPDAPSINLGNYSLQETYHGNNADLTVSASPSAAPEPATWLLMLGGIGVAGLMMRRRSTAFAIA